MPPKLPSSTNGLTRRQLLGAGALAGASLLLPPRAAEAAVSLSKECDVGQGYSFKPTGRQAFGYITSWSIGDKVLTPDIKVLAPSASAPSGAAVSQSVLSVLSGLTWSTLPNENITLQGRISLAAAQQLQMFALQSLKKAVMWVSFVTYEYDPVSQAYFTSVKTNLGVPPSPTVKPPGPINPATPPLYALLGGQGFQVAAKVEEDPIGVKNHAFTLTLAPPIVPTAEQILIQTSSKTKVVQPWGLPQR